MLKCVLLNVLKSFFLNYLVAFILLFQNILKVILGNNILRLIFLLVKFIFVHLIFWFLNVILDMINYLLWKIWWKQLFLLRLVIYRIMLRFELETILVFNSAFSCWKIFIFSIDSLYLLFILFSIFKFFRFWLDLLAHWSKILIVL